MRSWVLGHDPCPDRLAQQAWEILFLIPLGRVLVCFCGVSVFSRWFSLLPKFYSILPLAAVSVLFRLARAESIPSAPGLTPSGERWLHRMTPLESITKRARADSPTFSLKAPYF